MTKPKTIEEVLEKMWVVPFYKAWWLALTKPMTWRMVKYTIEYESGRKVVTWGVSKWKNTL